MEMAQFIEGISPEILALAYAVSMIIPVCNAAKFIPELFESLCRQQWDGKWEIVVADNGSTDGSLALIETYRDHLPGDLRIVKATQGRGSAYTRNAGAKAARGRAFLFIDHDDVISEGYVAAMGKALEEQPFVCSRWEVEKLNPEWTYAERPSGQWEGPMDYNYRFLTYAAGGTLGIRREVFEAVGGFDEKLLFSDCTDLCWRVQLETDAKLGFVPEALVHYRYRHSLKSIFLQARQWGIGEVGLYAYWRDRGVPRISAYKSFRRFCRMFRLQFLKLLFSRGGWAWWATELGSRVGRIEASVRNRTLML